MAQLTNPHHAIFRNLDPSDWNEEEKAEMRSKLKALHMQPIPPGPYPWLWRDLATKKEKWVLVTFPERNLPFIMWHNQRPGHYKAEIEFHTECVRVEPQSMVLFSILDSHYDPAKGEMVRDSKYFLQRGCGARDAAEIITNEYRNWYHYDEAIQQRLDDHLMMRRARLDEERDREAASALLKVSKPVVQEVDQKESGAQEPPRRSNRIRIQSLKARAHAEPSKKGPQPWSPPVAVRARPGPTVKKGPTKRKVAEPSEAPLAKIKKEPGSPVRGLPGSEILGPHSKKSTPDSVDVTRITKRLQFEGDCEEAPGQAKLRAKVNKLMSKEVKLGSNTFWQKNMKKDPGKIARLVLKCLSEDARERMVIQCLSLMTSRQQLDMALKFRVESLRNLTTMRIRVSEQLAEVERKSYEKITIGPRPKPKDSEEGPEEGPVDAGPVIDLISDEGAVDEGPVDEGPVDEGPVDAGPNDAGPNDAGPVDAGPNDAGPVDAGPVDAGPSDEGFVHKPYYIRSKWSKSGYAGVGYQARTGSKKVWRVKYNGSTCGRFETKAQACEMYFDLKQAEKRAPSQEVETKQPAWYDSLSFDE